MVSIQEEDKRPEFNFGEDEEEFNEIQNLVSQFTRMPNTLPNYYLFSKAFPKRENPISNQNNGPSSQTSPS